MRQRERAEDERREGLRGVSNSSSKKGPRRSQYITSLPLFFTRQAVLATFSRSVASASCQRKQRARFVKPKVKLRSNEGTVLLGGTSGIILPQPPAARMRRTLNVKWQLLSHGTEKRHV
ncbi:hypothetical protein CesoFtcFv8_003855 [Champsocephalus esox]|uniref:Uncharacterized protein n=1 Tax=Champsocephalus esox TaxID=159716 RepID=A0AAN8CUY0_9TELE|nr:hypothetical protein CesoFtcFv8_003855 [Champsocephalus esox]